MNDSRSSHFGIVGEEVGYGETGDCDQVRRM
jgi:hypothetical protein